LTGINKVINILDMSDKNSPLKGLMLVVFALVLIFVFLSFASPLVPLSRVSINGVERIEIKRIEQYFSAKTSMGLLSTSNKKFDDASDILGPLIDKIEIDSRFFFKATATVFEKQDTFAIGWGDSGAKITVDIEGNYIEDIVPVAEKSTEFDLLAKDVRQIYKLGVPRNDQYPFYVNEDDVSINNNNYLFRELVAEILQTKGFLGLNFAKVFVNQATYFLYRNMRGEYILVAPSSINPMFVEQNGEIMEWDEEKYTREDTGNEGDGIPYILYNKVNLENAQGLFGETSQGVIVFFGTSSDLDIKFGALGELVATYFSAGEQLPLLIKLDIIRQVTTVPRSLTAGGS